MLREMLYVLVVFALALQGAYVHGQDCDETFDMQNPIGLNTMLDTSCILCSNDEGAGDNNWSLLSGGPPNGATIDGNTLRITDAVAFLGGQIIALRCGALFQAVTAAGFFAPTTFITNNGVVVEGNNINLVCSDINVPESVSVQWLNTTNQVVETIGNLQLNNVQRSEAGVYTCRLTEISTNATLSDTINLIVHYPPSIVSNDSASIMVFVTGRISLLCTYDSEPGSNVEWLQNGEPLMNGVDGVTINLNDRVSSLLRINLDADSGGIYTCRATNMIGVTPNTIEAFANASTEIIIQVPPEAPSNLVVSNIQEDSFDLAWTNGMDGRSPITSVTVEILVLPDALVIQNLNLTQTLEMTPVTGLNPFTRYSLSVTVNNAVGEGNSASITAMTLSLELEAPRMVTLTSPTSTSLQVTWIDPDVNSLRTSPPMAWFIELSDSNGMVVNTTIEPDPDTRTVTFENLPKGTTYSVRVAGNNTRGIGAYSAIVTNQTLVDPPTIPLMLSVDGVSATGLRFSWSLPEDNGGRPVIMYVVRYRPVGDPTFAEVDVNGTSLLLFNGGDPTPPIDIINSTNYEVEVVAVNTAGRGDSATAQVTTQSLDMPQPIFIPPISNELTNRTAVISWVFPGGQVDMYIVQFKERLDDWNTVAEVTTITVPGNITTLMLTGLIPSTSYDVRVATSNSLGESAFSFEINFITAPPFPPTVAGPNSAFAGDRTQLNCSSSVSDVIDLRWVRYNPSRSSLPNSAIQVGNDLVFTEPMSTDTGIYSCILGSTNVGTNHTISFLTPPTQPGPVVSEVVIISVGVVGGVALIIFLLVLGLACYFTCCSSSGPKKSSSYNVKSKAKKPKSGGRHIGKGKRGMTWIETSTKFVPKTGQRKRDDDASPFDMPEDLTGHSSFNTLEKQNRIRQGADSNV